MKNRIDINTIILICILTFSGCMILDLKFRFSDVAKYYLRIPAERYFQKDAYKQRIRMGFVKLDASIHRSALNSEL